MNRIFMVLGLLLCFQYSNGQRVVIDTRHLATVIENGTVRSAAESTHQQYLGKINNNLQTINVNVGTVVLAQTMIYEGLSNVNSALKNGMAVRDLSVIIGDIATYCQQSIALARSEPYLLLFAEEHALEIRNRALRLVSDVSAFILKEGDNVLADYNSRDQLLRHVKYELQIISAMAYGAWKAMFWAKQKGIVYAINPFAGFIQQDKQFVEDIIRNAKFLRK